MFGWLFYCMSAGATIAWSQKNTYICEGWARMAWDPEETAQSRGLQHLTRFAKTSPMASPLIANRH